MRSLTINEPIILSSNLIKTTHYTIANFIPKNIVFQFSKWANFYFLFLLILQLCPLFAITSPVFAAVPLIAVVAVSMLKDALEDYQRYKSDLIQNNLTFEIFGIGHLASRDIKLGHIVVIYEDQQIPADIVLLHSSENNGYCYIETKNLDGETNMKLRSSISTLPLKADVLKRLDVPKLPIQVEEPINQIYSFSGNYDGKSLSLDNTIWRGCTLKHTDFIVGVVIYTGQETRIQMNTGTKGQKLSSVDRKTNPFVIGNLLLLLLFVFISSVGFVVDASLDPWFSASENKYFLAFLHIFDGLLAFQNIVPLSLFITVEIIKGLQSYWIYCDKEMRGKQPALARTWTLADELGLVDIIFSDKTGTLTENKMNFIACGIMHNRYTMDNPLPIDGDIDVFFTILLCCHTVVIEHKDQNKIYVSESPDEIALLTKAKDCGFVFDHRDGNMITLKIREKSYHYTILHVIEFTSSRKRMSVIVQSFDGKIILFTKGADDLMFKRCIPNPSVQISIDSHLQSFAQSGLRTLCFSYKEIKPDYYQSWQKRYKDVLQSEASKDQIARLYDEIEQDWTIVGATGIEDKLQEYVPQAIKLFQEAGILVWILTGDKVETAMSIGFSTHLLKPEQKLFVIRGKQADISTELELFAKQLQVNINNNALVIDGEALEQALSPIHVDLFLRFCARCSSVICCRVSPLQKAEVVKMVRLKQDVITLAIGDGANDVNMIQTAHIGVGIRGVEGMQAAMNADYAIDKFRFLVSLVLVHGHWNYHRISWMILTFFQKNVIWVGVLFWFQFHSFFSYEYVWDFSYMMMFNVLFTALPVAAIGGFDKTVERSVLLGVPSLYKCSQSNSIYTYQNFLLVMFVGLYQSVICFYVPFLAYYNIILDGGRTVDKITVGTTMAIAAVLNANLYCLLCSKYWTIIHLAFVWGSTLTILIYVIGASFAVQSPLYGVVNTTLGSIIFWFTLIMTTSLCQLPWLLYEFMRRTYFSTDIDIFQEIYKTGGLTIVTEPQQLPRYSSLELRSPLPQIIASPLPSSVLERNSSKFGLQPLIPDPINTNLNHRNSILSNQSSVIILNGDQQHHGFAFSKEDGVGRAESIIKSPEKRKLDRRHTISVVRPIRVHQHRRSRSHDR
eukprot:NODE_101_length_19951_cov_0.932501.p1 type:complete len:1126 gc:universal NODE_101_length_19951_cov_0.932501:4012-635(-)